MIRLAGVSRLQPARYAQSLNRCCCQYGIKITGRSLSTVGWKVDLDTGIVTFQTKPLFQTVIGMEIHAQLDIATKLFSSASTASATPNQAVHPLDVAVPGFLPVLSHDAVQAAVLTAAACNCELQKVSRFERKHYSYADQPLGYQITQQRWPLARNGKLQSRKRALPGKTKEKNETDKFISVGIDRIQLEQDTGKTTTVTTRTVSGTV
jgi:aspartyl-tRNA(Asn)/glutamyl-tRNA(Gln) amidotransferase subunit B